MVANYQPLLTDDIVPGLTETVFVKEYDKMRSISTPAVPTDGQNYVTNIRTSITTNASTYDRTDVNPQPDSFETVQASWARVPSHVSFEVHNLDIIQAANRGTNAVTSLIEDASRLAVEQLMQLNWNRHYTSIKADFDATAAYSDNSISRTTYPTLASYEEATDTAITLAILRTCKETTVLNKSVNPMDYVWLMESAVFNKFNPLAAALHTWNTVGVKGQEFASGYQPAGSWEGNDVETFSGMTTGDVFFIRRQDLKLDLWRPLSIEQTPTGKDSVGFVARLGVDMYGINPGFNAKMTSKD